MPTPIILRCGIDGTIGIVTKEANGAVTLTRTDRGTRKSPEAARQFTPSEP